MECLQETPFSETLQTRLLMCPIDPSIKQTPDQNDLSMSEMSQAPAVSQFLRRARPRAGRSLLGGPAALSPLTPR